MSSVIVNPTDFKPSEDVRFTRPKVNKSGGKSVGIINSTTNKSLMLSTPLMLCWGVNVRENDTTGLPSYDLSIQFPDSKYARKEEMELLQKMADFEQHVLKSAKENTKDWFNKSSMSEEVLEALFHPMLKYPKDPNTDEPDKTRSPTLRVKLPTWDGEYKFELYDMEHNLLLPNEQEITPDALIEKGANIACIIQCGGIWFASGKFGVTWKLVQAVVKPSVNVKKGTCYIQLSSEEQEKLAGQKSSGAKDTTYASDGEEETEEAASDEASQEEEEVEEPPEEKPKKRGGRKKAT